MVTREWHSGFGLRSVANCSLVVFDFILQPVSIQFRDFDLVIIVATDIDIAAVEKLKSNGSGLIKCLKTAIQEVFDMLGIAMIRRVDQGRFRYHVLDFFCYTST
jgi:hypothetical protein